MKITASKNTNQGLIFDFEEAPLSQNSSKPTLEEADMTLFLKDI